MEVALSNPKEVVDSNNHLSFCAGGLTRARILGSTATTSDKHFMALVLIAIAFSPSTLKIFTGDTERIKSVACNVISSLSQAQLILLPVINKYQNSVRMAS